MFFDVIFYDQKCHLWDTQFEFPTVYVRKTIQIKKVQYMAYHPFAIFLLFTVQKQSFADVFQNRCS